MRALIGKLLRGKRGRKPATLLGRLRTDVRGNTIAIMAAALIPLCGMVGGGMDMARLYMTKTRLQHACDAGALAGRKQMGAGNWGADDLAAAQQFFDGNYGTGAYTSTGLTRTFSENAGKVTGNATATLPMTLMRVLGKTSETLTVTCDAEMRLPNTDVMFVLDTTGSMNCVAGDTTCTNNGNTPAAGSKIDGLKAAVKCFYETLAQLDTGEPACSGSPSGGTSSAVQLRFGFVPYASNVNVGHLLRSDWFTDTSNYQTRQRVGTNTDWGSWHSVTLYYYYGCPGRNNSGTVEYNNVSCSKYNGIIYRNSFDTRIKGPLWTYDSLSVNTSALKSGTGWNTAYSFTRNINNDGSARTIPWEGCIEERPSWGSLTSSYTPLPTVNDISQRPTAVADTRWRPALPNQIFYRNRFDTDGDTDSVTTTGTLSTANLYYNSASVASCPTEARLLQEWPSATTFAGYVDSLDASGNTYHDIGMLWGARLMWPGGMFDGGITGPDGTAYAGNATAANGGQIQRHMIFMTDGDSTSNPCDYNSNGVPWFDKRQTTDVGNASDCGSRRQALIDQINTRLERLCTLVKNQGITLWVVSYGGGLNSDTETRLENCASDPDSVAADHYFQATTASDLQTKFAVIAAAISQLRLTR